MMDGDSCYECEYNERCLSLFCDTCEDIVIYPIGLIGTSYPSHVPDRGR